MKTLEGVWRRDANGEFKVFVGGKEQVTIGSVVEVIPRYGESKYTVITGTNSKIKGGYLYDYRFTSKPKANNKPVSNLPNIDLTQFQAVDKKFEEVSIEDLDEALGLD